MNNENSYSMSEQYMEHIAELMEKHRLDIIHGRRQATHSHWKRRTVAVVVIIGSSVIAHYALKNPAVEAFADSLEMVVSSAIEYLFTKATEWE